MTFDQMLRCQKAFSDIFFDDTKLTSTEREEMTRSFVLALHGELSELVSSINFKTHRTSRKTPDREKILYESVDVLRYLMAIMNIWGITSQEFVSAFNDKDVFLHKRHKDENTSWDGRPVLIVDIDDVISEFRKHFFDWLDAKHGIRIDQDYPEYYASSPLNERGINPESVFKDYISDRALRSIPVIDGVVQVLQTARDLGFWVQLLTARPDQNLICLYDTYHWIQQHDIPHDGIAFSPEKYRWVVQSPYYGHVAGCIDDSSKHAAEYAMHGLRVISPKTSYNSSLIGTKNIEFYETQQELLDIIKKIREESHATKS